MAAENPCAETGCCPRFDPAPWDETEVEFDGKLFVKDRVRSILHIPINFGKVMVRMMGRIDAADAKSDDYLLLCDEKSLWGADVYVAVTKEVPDAENVRLSGRFLTKAFEGPYKDGHKWCKTMREYVAGKGEELKKVYNFYTTCPRCAKAYGKNWVVLLAQV